MPGLELVDVEEMMLSWVISGLMESFAFGSLWDLGILVDSSSDSSESDMLSNNDGSVGFRAERIGLCEGGEDGS